MSLVSQSLTLRWSISCPIPHSIDSLGKVVNLSSDYKDEILAEPEVNQPNPSDLDFHRTNILPPLRPPIDELLIQLESETNERLHSLMQEICFKDAQWNFHDRIVGVMNPILQKSEQVLLHARVSDGTTDEPKQEVPH
ncbi:unnamed protein product [Vicia faba]|uniref:Uncharacterized protein n=1 Tax=Vicia faba TaxID=3906 RepID=A0AAV0ZLW7_VICFA|nr:unnamed protein product [Vicia faba]